MLDALAPHALAFAALIAAYQSFPARYPGAVFVVVVVVVLTVGTAVQFFRDMTPAHSAWPVALILLVVVLPLMALDAPLERSALNAPIPIHLRQAVAHLVPLAFTWGSLAATTLLLCLLVGALAADLPRWGTVALLPLPLALGWLPALAVRPTEQQWFVAALTTFALAQIVAAVGWLVPERRRLLVVPFALAADAMLILRDHPPGFSDLPGRALLLGDAALIAFACLLMFLAPRISHRFRRADAAPPAPSQTV